MVVSYTKVTFRLSLCDSIAPLSIKFYLRDLIVHNRTAEMCSDSALQKDNSNEEEIT